MMARGWVGGCQSRPRTVISAASTPHCSSGVTWPTRSPSLPTSTAPTCSTSTRVVTPSISTSGRNDAGRALRDVGAINTTDRGRNASECTTTPYLLPCCSCPTPLGSLSAKTSPRRTQALHQVCARKHLGPVRLVGFQGGDLGSEGLLVPEPRRGVDESTADRLGATHPRRLQLGERRERFLVPPHGDRAGHGKSVART